MKLQEYHPGYRLRPLAQWRFEQRVLNKINRWGGRVMPDGYHETVLHHVKAMWKMVDEITHPQRYPHLAQEIHSERLKDLSYFHDAGEKRRGDINRDHPQYSQNKITSDKLDEVFFQNTLVPRLPFGSVVGRIGAYVSPRSRQYAQEIRNWALSSYVDAEHVTPQSTDKEALLLKVLDRTQGGDGALTHFYNVTQLEKVGRMSPRERNRRNIPDLSEKKIVEILYGNFTASAPYLHQLLTLVSDGAKLELVDYFAKVEQKYTQAGRKQAFTPFVDAFDGIFVDGKNLRDSIQEKTTPTF